MMFSHWERWCAEWARIGRVASMNIGPATQEATMDLLLYGTCAMRWTPEGKVERIHPNHLIVVKR